MCVCVFVCVYGKNKEGEKKCGQLILEQKIYNHWENGEINLLEKHNKFIYITRCWPRQGYSPLHWVIISPVQWRSCQGHPRLAFCYLVKCVEQIDKQGNLRQENDWNESWAVKFMEEEVRTERGWWKYGARILEVQSQRHCECSWVIRSHG